MLLKLNGYITSHVFDSEKEDYNSKEIVINTENIILIQESDYQWKYTKSITVGITNERRETIYVDEDNYNKIINMKLIN